MSFLIIPDGPAADVIAREAADHLGPSGLRLITHASGRPWVLGDWADEDLRLITVGTHRLVILGRTRLNASAVAEVLGRARTLGDLDAVARDLPGSCHLAASMDGRTRSQGAVSTARQIFYTQFAGTTVAADSPGPLAALTNARIAEDALALRLLTPAVPWPLSHRCLWSGVHELSVGCWLEVGPGDTRRAVRWWSPPESGVPLSDAAAAIRAALVDAVAIRVQGRDTVSADLSGGMDSTCLCFMAAASAPNLITYHWKPMDHANDDTEWADRAARYLPAKRHRSVDIEHVPRFDDRPDGCGPLDDIEGPPPWNRGRAHKAAVARAVAAEGSALHLIGLGGDELFGALPAYLWSLVRTHPLTSIRVVRRSQLQNRWGLVSTVRGLADSAGFPACLEATARDITAAPPGPFDVSLGWTGQPRMPPWATGDATDSVRSQLRAAAAAAAAPLDPDRVRHQVLDSVITSGRAVRQLRYALARFGVDWEAPYLDDRVIEAALSVRVQDRVVAGRYKPLLTAAMQGVVPGPLLGRRSKGEFSAEAFDGLRRSRPVLLEQCDDLYLARMGLVNAGALRAALLNPGPETRHLIPFENTLSCETWLRSPSVATAQRTNVPGGTRS